MAKKSSTKNKSTLLGTASADVLTVKHSQVTVNAGKGNDTIIITKGSSHKIYGEAGKDTITVKSTGTGMKVYGDDAKGKLTGNDTFNINGGKKNTFYGGKGVDTFNVNAGTTNYIYGGAGNDVIVIGKNSTGTAVVKDFSVKSGNKDSVKVTGGAVKSITASGKNMIVKGGKSASVTLEGAKTKTFTVTDTLGSYTVSGANVKLALGKNVKGTVTAASFLTTVDARSDANAITINGNAKNNTIYGGAGNNVLNGGAGNDTLSGGAGKDTFVYANGQGKDTVSDYVAGQDTLQISSGSISKAALANSNKDLVFTVGSGSITLKNAAAKAISLKDSRGNYTASNTAITLASNFTGTMDATKYLSSVKTIDGRNATKAVNIIGNAQNNTIYVGKAGGTINGGAGNDVLYGGVGNDNFIYNSGNDTIYNYASGSDTINLSSTALKSSSVSGEDTVLNLVNGQKITVKNAANIDILVIDSSGRELTINNSNNVEGINTVYGSDGADTFIYDVVDGNAIIKDYTEGEDTLQIADCEITKTEIVDGNVVLTVGDEGNTVTLEGASGKSIVIHANNGSFTLTDEEIILGSDYIGNMDANAYLATVTTIDGRNAEGTVNITGNAKANIIYAGKTGGALNGGIGNDTLYGGVGNDVFVYAYGEGKDTINDYVEGQDVLEISSGSIIKTTLANSNKDLVFTVWNGRIINDGNRVTITDAATKMINLKSNCGNYTVSNTEIKLGSDFRGDIDANAYLSTVTTIDGRSAEESVNITGNNQANIIYAGKAGGTINGGAGDDTLYGGAGEDTFLYVPANSGKDIIRNYTEGEDKLVIKNHSLGRRSIINEKDVKFIISTGSVTFENAVGKTISIVDEYGSYTVSDTDIILGDDFNGSTCTFSPHDFFPTVITIDGRNSKESMDIIGNSQNNIIYAGQSGGRYLGWDGDDIINGGIGDDKLEGGAGADKLYGGVGNDMLYGNVESPSNSYIDGNDELHGGAGDDKLYGGDGNDELYGDDGDDTLAGGDGTDELYGGAGDDTLCGGLGDDTLTGGTGRDTFVYANSDGNDTITDFYGEHNVYGDQDALNWDTLQITSGTISNVTKKSNNNLVFTIGDGTVTLVGAATMSVNIKDNCGSYSASVNSSTITLGSDYTGTMDASGLGIFTTIDGWNVENTINITGNTRDNVIYAGKAGGTYMGGIGIDELHGNVGNDTLYGDEGNDILYGNTGNDTLYGGEGNDTLHGNSCYAGDEDNDILYGGAGQDTFVFDGEGNDIIADYTAGQDTLEINCGLVAYNTAFAKSNNDLIITVNKKNSTGTVTLTNVAGQTISLKDSHGSYNESDTTLTLGEDYWGTIDANAHLSTITTIDGSAATNAVNILGNENNNTIYAGQAGGLINGGKGENTLYGGSGEDTFVFSLGGQSAIKNFTDGEDIIKVEKGDFTSGITRAEWLARPNQYLHVIEFSSSDGASTIRIDDSVKTLKYINSFDEMVTLNVISGATNGYQFYSSYNTIKGGTQNDMIVGGSANDHIYGKDGDDYLFGGYCQGTNLSGDELYGENGNDVLYGYGKLYGGEGNDILYGSGEFHGGAGDDTLWVDRWIVSMLYGDDGKDTFVFDAGSSGTYNIMDYEVGEDIIKFNNGIKYSSSSVSDGDVYLNLNNTGIVRIAGAAGQNITFEDRNGNITTEVFS